MPRISLLRRLAAAPLVAAALAALAALPAGAAGQIGNQSDHTGPLVTGGLMGFLPVVSRPTRNAPLVDRNGRIHYGSTRVACAVSAAADSLLEALADGRLQPSRAFAGQTIPAEAQRALHDVVQPRGLAPADTVAFAASLAVPAGAAAAGMDDAHAREVTHYLYGLLNGSESCQSGQGTVPPDPLAHAMNAYGELVGAAPGSVLRAPSGELLAVQALLEALALAAVNGAR